MELRHLRYFVAVAEARGFSRAARLLHLSQPSLSRQIQSLEDELGTVLFERRNGSVLLTRSGEFLLEGARRLLDDAQRMVDQVRASIPPPRHA